MQTSKLSFSHLARIIFLRCTFLLVTGNLIIYYLGLTICDITLEKICHDSRNPDKILNLQSYIINNSERMEII